MEDIASTIKYAVEMARRQVGFGRLKPVPMPTQLMLMTLWGDFKSGATGAYYENKHLLLAPEFRDQRTAGFIRGVTLGG
jgi:hypothetical protein